MLTWALLVLCFLLMSWEKQMEASQTNPMLPCAQGCSGAEMASFIQPGWETVPDLLRVMGLLGSVSNIEQVHTQGGPLRVENKAERRHRHS